MNLLSRQPAPDYRRLLAALWRRGLPDRVPFVELFADQEIIDECNRRMLGLPPGRRLYGPEIREAYKRAAKTLHPDVGGSEREFLALSAARDALLKGR